MTKALVRRAALTAATLVFLLLNLPATSEARQGAKTRKASSARAGLRTKVYSLGRLDGALAGPLFALIHPLPWKGQTDGVVLMPASALATLTKAQQQALATLHRKGLPVVITHASQDHIDALNSALGIAKTGDLPTGLKYLDFYASTLSRGGFRSFLMAPSLPVDQDEVNPAESRSDLYSRTQEFLKWIRDAKSGGRRMAHASQNNPVQINNSNSWQATFNQPVQYYWASCSTPTYSCTNNYQLQVNVWPVYSQSNAQINVNNPSSQQQPIDFFIMQLSGNLNSSGCFGFYNKSHPNRISAYWARQYNLGAAVADNWSIADLNIANGWSPQAANPATTVTTGTTWNLSGTGNIGMKGSTAAFTAGVQFNNSNTTTYQALQVQPNIGASSLAPNAASWTYDSWNYVHQKIQPTNGLCGGPGFATLPPIISNSTFSPVDTWVWQALPAVRQKYNGGTLPIQIDLSVLLGWTYYHGSEASCKPKGSHGDAYPMQVNSVAPTYEVGSGTLQGLTFDVGCQVATLYGTIPLGPTSNQNWSAGNPGTPYPAVSTWTLNPPFASTTVAPSN